MAHVVPTMRTTRAEADTDMCLGIPGRIVAIEPGNPVARVDVAGVVREINLMLLDGPFAPDDYILIHSGFALERMTAEQAREALAAFEEADLTAPRDGLTLPDGPTR